MFVIRTKRTTLRPLSPSDASALADAVFADPEVAKTLVGNWSDPATRVAQAQEWIESAQHWDDGGYGIWGIYGAARLTETPGTLIGLCAADKAPAAIAEGPEIYYALSRNVWGKGVATEVVTAVVQFLFESAKVAAVEALYYPEINEASVRIAKRLGFKFIGRYPILAYVEDQAQETMEYDLWRIENCEDSGNLTTLKDTAFKIGLFVGEGAMRIEDATRRLLRAAKINCIVGSNDEVTIERLLIDRLAAGASAGGFMHYRLGRP